MKGIAWAPAHITSFFSVPPRQDYDTPLHCGSTGAGICLDIGVLVKVSISDDPYINISHNDKLVSDPVTETTLKGLLPQGWGADCELLLGAPLTALETLDGGDEKASFASESHTPSTTTKLPLGAGLGMSGACALAAGVAALIALGEWDGCPRPGEAYPGKAVANAHIAEVLHRTGMGDVAAQAACFATAQPLEIRRHPGVADLQRNVETYGWNGEPIDEKIQGKAATEAPQKASSSNDDDGSNDPTQNRVVLCLSTKKVSTKATLDDEKKMDLVQRAGARAKRGLPAVPTAIDLTRLGARFVNDAELFPPSLAEALDAANALNDTQASVAMLGATLYGIGDIDGLVKAWQDVGDVVVCGDLK